jgi:hypothetical protein
LPAFRSPRRGGAIAAGLAVLTALSVKAPGGENLLDADPKYWKGPYPLPSIETPFEPWNGRIVWAGPQSGFWSQQDLQPQRRAEHAVWPPDPFGETGRFEVLERTTQRVRLRGSVSPVTGLVLEHVYEIVGERTARFRTVATNGRPTPVSWDLWPNTRVRPEGFPYVAVDPARPPRQDGPASDDPDARPYPSETREGWLSLPPGRRPEAPQTRLWTKAYVCPARGFIAFFHRHELLLLQAAVVPPEELHPEQAFVEIYRGAGEGHDILELEMHGPYETLAPGASMTFEQVLELVPYEGPQTPEGHRAFLARLKG